jgi:hypothetical protein
MNAVDENRRGGGTDGKGGEAASFLSEATEAGEQSCAEPVRGTGGQQLLVPGLRPLRLADRLLLLASAPLAPTKPQRAADFGLFDLNARNQLELFAARPTREHNS